MTDQQTILQNLGFDSLTDMQRDMGARGLKPGGVVLLSPTGSGKTLAYLLPLVKLIRPELDTLQAVVVVPTRELATQSEDILKQMKCGVRSMSLYGGRPAMQEHRALREVKPQVVFATPGRLLDHLNKENLNARGAQLLVIDEFDKCLELGFQAEMEEVTTRLPRPARCWLMSATDAPAIPDFMAHVALSFDKADYLPATGEAAPEQRIAVHQVMSPEKDKLNTLGYLLTTLKGRPSIVFVAHRESADRIANWLRGEKFAVVCYHGGMEQEVRERSLYRFRNGSANVLVSTDLAARGLDIPEVEAVIHYHLPLKAEEYTHRNGRTARWEARGDIYLITGPQEQLPEFAADARPIEIAQTGPLRPTPPLNTTIYIGRGKQDKLSKGDVLGFLCKKGGLKAGDIGRIDVAAHAAYVAVSRKMVNNVLRQVAGEKIKGMKTRIEEARK